MGRRVAQLMAQVLQNLEPQVAQGEDTKHRDETGFRINGRTWWLHIMGTLTLTGYRTAATRGSMFEFLPGRVVHDGMPSYAKLASLIHGYCNAHLLRDLQAAREKNEMGAQNRLRFLLGLERYVRRAKDRASKAGNRGSPNLSDAIWKKISRRDGDILKMALADHEAWPLKSTNKRGRPKKRPGHNLALRMQAKQEDILRLVKDWAIPFTNHLAERDLRMMKLGRNIFGGFRTEEGARDVVALYRISSTVQKREWDIIQTMELSPEELEVKLKAA